MVPRPAGAPGGPQGCERQDAGTADTLSNACELPPFSCVRSPLQGRSEQDGTSPSQVTGRCRMVAPSGPRPCSRMRRRRSGTIPSALNPRTARLRAPAPAFTLAVPAIRDGAKQRCERLTSCCG
jgi:hypothetical protein